MKHAAVENSSMNDMGCLPAQSATMKNMEAASTLAIPAVRGLGDQVASEAGVTALPRMWGGSLPRFGGVARVVLSTRAISQVADPAGILDVLAHGFPFARTSERSLTGGPLDGYERGVLRPACLI